MAQYELNVIDYLILKKRKYLILLSAHGRGLYIPFSELLKPSNLRSLRTSEV